MDSLGRLAATSLLLALLSGCAAPQAAPDEATPLEQAEQAAQEVEVQATKTTGVLRGVVVDQAIRPLPGAVVSLAERDGNTTTDDSGVFAFDGLEPGAYFLTASKADYTTVRQSVDVVAGVSNPEPVRVLLQMVPRAAPFIEEHHVKLFVSASVWIEAGVSTGATLGGNGVLSEAGTGFKVDIQPNATVAQSELSWESTSPLGAQARTAGGTYRENEKFDVAILQGPSPIVKRSNATTDRSTADNVRHNFYAWPVTAVPVGATVNQQVDAFVLVFHNFHPKEGWVFSRDGPHPIPEQ